MICTKQRNCGSQNVPLGAYASERSGSFWTCRAVCEVAGKWQVLRRTMNGGNREAYRFAALVSVQWSADVLPVRWASFASWGERPGSAWQSVVDRRKDAHLASRR